jgi:uncharacterized membrane protein YedE/YeeE
MEALIDLFGDAGTLALAGGCVGVVFGFAAQRSRFCLRAATVEVAEGTYGPRLSVWLIAFTSALALVQLLISFGLLDLSESRVIASVGSLSGALIGGLMFGVGMILARGCPSRLLVLASCGNLRALVTGLVVTLVAQAAFRGALSPIRENLAQLWTIAGGEGRDLASVIGLSAQSIGLTAALALGAALAFSRMRGVPVIQIVASVGVGSAVAMGWYATYAVSQASFDVVPISSITFTGPATDTLMALVAEREVTLSFGIGLVPGVAVGAGLAAAISGEWQIERFGPDTPMERYLIGAVFMGFGAMLAGGCAVGSGLSGGSAMSLTSWFAVLSMWLGALIAQQIMARAPVRPVA